MAFPTNIGTSAAFQGTATNAGDSANIAIPSLGANRVGIVIAKLMPAGPGQTITGATWDGVAMTAAGAEVTNGNYRVRIFYLIGCAHNKTATIAVNYGANQVHTFSHSVLWCDGTNTINFGNANSATGTGQNLSCTNTLTNPGLMVSGSVSAANANGTPAVGADCTLIEAYSPGGDSAAGAYSAEASSGTKTHTHNYSQATQAYSWQTASFYESAANTGPSIAQDTADGAYLDTLAPLEFTGSDVDGDDLRYNLQVTNNPDAFVGGSQITDSWTLETGGAISFHTNPVSGTTWEGHTPVDDRPGQVFRAKGGVLDKIELLFTPFETDPTLTNGSYLCRVYPLEGLRATGAVSAWAANTAYSLGDVRRPTSTANADVHFLYRCVQAGTSHATTEPTWPKVEAAEVTDGTVVWRAHRGAGPRFFAAYDQTPTRGWIAQSDVTTYNPGAADPGWKTLNFSGGNRVRLVKDEWYCVVADWRPANTNVNNGLTFRASTPPDATHQGNCYLDGQHVTNVGPRITDDLNFKVYEVFTLLDKVSGTDAGFTNTQNGADTDPFTAGQKIRFTVQSADRLYPEAQYWWRVRVIDPLGTNIYSSWSATRTFHTAPRHVPRGPGSPGQSRNLRL